MEAHRLSHRGRLEACISGGNPDRPPIALWRHFPVDDQTPDGLAAATIAFQKDYDFDLVKVTPASSFCLRDWGVEDEWRGATEGTREYTRRRIKNPEDWLQLEGLDPYKGYLGISINLPPPGVQGSGFKDPSDPNNIQPNGTSQEPGGRSGFAGASA